MLNLRNLANATMTVLLVGAIAACGSDSSTTSPGGASGSFTATITGGAAGSYRGFAGATVQAGFTTIALGTTDTKFALAFTKSGTRPVER